MKKSLLLILLIISSLICSSQLQVKEGSFKKVEGFVNINTEKMFDDNDRPYSVLKIKTENINDKQRRELSFGGDAQTFFETEYKDGEVWLYISYYATFLKISHPDLSSTEFWFPFDMEPKRGYELTLVNKPALDEEIISRIEKLENSKSAVTGNPDNYGYIVIKTGSLEGATAYIDGEEMEMKTPFVSDPIEQGPHKIRVVKDGYETYSDIVAVEGKGMRTVNVDLKKVKTTNPYRHKGFVFIPEMSVTVDINHHYEDFTPIAITPKLNIEYMFGPHLGLGVGSGAMFFAKSLSAVPVYGQFSVYFTKRKASPFINAKGGYAINVSTFSDDKYYNYVYDNFNIKGLFASVTVGVNIRRSRIGITLESYGYEERYELTSFALQQYHSGDFTFVGVTYSYIIPFSKK